MNDRATYRFDVRFDVTRMIDDLRRIGDQEWITLDFSTDWSGVALRSADGEPSTLGLASAYQDTSLLSRCDYFGHVLSYFRCPLHRARLLRLAGGGGSIGKHRDPVPEGPPLVRLHIPITGAEAMEFTLGDDVVDMRAGELWYTDVTRPHSVINRGTEDRVSLIVDCEVDAWLDGLLGAPHRVAS